MSLVAQTPEQTPASWLQLKSRPAAVPANVCCPLSVRSAFQQGGASVGAGPSGVIDFLRMAKPGKKLETRVFKTPTPTHTHTHAHCYELQKELRDLTHLTNQPNKRGDKAVKTVSKDPPSCRACGKLCSRGHNSGTVSDLGYPVSTTPGLIAYCVRAKPQARRLEIQAGAAARLEPDPDAIDGITGLVDAWPST
ncbi:hypothetical protein RRG08_038177 [Elysia crispata]|uniref:Uncharacterized protein n=1 Tax=Elysia crispata TaxID=231223 RepID=A0AAE1AMK5_9GAST|nr:hypothetical protein RRG08_038177 [Elysia crispata]